MIRFGRVWRSLLAQGIVLCLIGLVAGPVAAQNAASATINTTMDQTSKSKLGFGHGSIIAAPIPLKNPALGTGLIGTAGYMFKLDAESDTSFIGAAGLYTNNGSMGAGLAANLYFGDGRWAIKALYGRADINYAVSSLSGAPFDDVPLSQSGTIGQLKASYGVTQNLAFGIDAQYLDTIIRLNSDTDFPLGNLPGFGVAIQELLVGPTIEWDSRDDNIYPTKGINVLFTGQYGQGLGRLQHNFQKGVLVGKGFVPVGKKGVFGFDGTICSVSDGAPFFNLCAVGLTDSLRGYPVGQYFSNALISAQAEFRYIFTPRWGGVAFAGTSSVGESFGSLTNPDAIYAGGVGVRYRLSKTFPIDFSFDVSVNKEGQVYQYIYLGQQF